MVRGQISVHTRLQMEIGPRLFTDPLHQTDERHDMGEQQSRAKLCLCSLDTVLNVKSFFFPTVKLAGH